jgi:hypothetical protein
MIAIASECPNAGFIHVFSICVVATILFVAVDDLEPNRRYALAFKFLPRLCECCGNRMKTDALTAVRLRQVRNKRDPGPSHLGPIVSFLN